MIDLSLTELKKNLNLVITKTREAACRVGRDPEEITIMAVTKTLPVEYIKMAQESGIRVFGENRVREASEKYRDLKGDFELHLIGHLQRNKAKRAAETFSWVQSLDKVETAIKLNQFCQELNKKLNVLLEVNTSGETSKEGVTSNKDLYPLLESILKLPFLKVRGLMTVGPFTQDEELICGSFRSLRELFIKCREICTDPGWDTLSMGMSGDFEIAIEEGSTLIRIGSAIFGPR